MFSLCSFIAAFLVALVVLVALTTTSASALEVAPYNESEALRSWFFAKAVGCNPSHIKEWTCEPCKTMAAGAYQGLAPESLTHVEVFYHEPLLARGYVGYSASRNQIVVTHSGTRIVNGSLIQWIMDLDFSWSKIASCPLGNCVAHAGFSLVWDVMKSATIAHVRALHALFPNATVAIQGHSLGAATATRASVDFLTTPGLPRLESVITFGSPRVFNYVAANWLAKLYEQNNVRSFRLVWASDPVPKVPFVAFAYVHMNHEVWYEANSTASIAPRCNDGPGQESLACQNSVSFLESDMNDHGWYLRVPCGCERC